MLALGMINLQPVGTSSTRAGYGKIVNIAGELGTGASQPVLPETGTERDYPISGYSMDLPKDPEMVLTKRDSRPSHSLFPPPFPSPPHRSRDTAIHSIGLARTVWHCIIAATRTANRFHLTFDLARSKTLLQKVVLIHNGKKLISVSSVIHTRAF